MSHFKKYRNKYVFLLLALLICGLFYNWNFDKHYSCKYKINPLWGSDLKPLNTSLVDGLKQEGLLFHEERGSEVGEEGICFGYFAGDEYWVVTYNQEIKSIELDVWIVGINIFGYFKKSAKYDRLISIIDKNN